MNIRSQMYSPLQNQAVWLGGWLYGHVSFDDLDEALGDLGGLRLVNKVGFDTQPPSVLESDREPLNRLEALRELRRETVTTRNADEPLMRLILSGPGDAPGLPAGSPAAEAVARNQQGAIALQGADGHHVLVPGQSGGMWDWFTELGPLPARSYLSPGEADHLLAEATSEAADLVESAGYGARTTPLPNPRLTVGTLSDFYDIPGLPRATPPRAAKLFARADRVAAIVETVTETVNDHSLDPHLLRLGRFIRQARMAGVSYAVA